MCGISGIYANTIKEDDWKLIDAVIKSQYARGPDHQESTLIKGQQSEILLGHNRLSIIDLSEHANQPMWDSTHRYCIVYNGEIYNYLELREELKKAGLHFKTESDTEVILNAYAHWGIDALQRFSGPFAFALFDLSEEKLWLCRDRFGVRPLYYIEQNNHLYFASTTNVLAKKFNLKPDISYLSRGLHYLVYEDGSQTTPYHGLFSLPAGCYLLSKLNSKGQLTNLIHSYYDLATKVQHVTEQLSLERMERLQDLLNDKLENAIKIRLRTDVPLAISLSGGLDSSSVAALVRKQHAHTIGFSFSHPHNKKSEGPLVAECANYLNIQIKYIWPSIDEMIEAMDQTITVQDAPFSTLSIVAQYLLYKHVRACGIKVLLGGQGGDEAFMGYKKFLLFWLQQLLREKRFFASAKHTLQLLPMFLAEITSFKAYWQHRHRYMYKSKQESSTLNLPMQTIHLNQKTQTLSQRQMQDITQFSLPTLLRYEDRNAMGNSVESRLPYMDHEMIEFGLALPEAVKLRSGYGKWIVREIMNHKIPDTIRLARYKRGFDIPLASLLQKGLGPTIREQLQKNISVISDFLNQSININSSFSDQQLLQRRNGMTEAITLLWLNRALT